MVTTPERDVETLRLAANLSLDQREYRAFAHLLMAIAKVTDQKVVIDTAYGEQRNILTGAIERILIGAKVKCGEFHWDLTDTALKVVTSTMSMVEQDERQDSLPGGNPCA